MRALRLALTPRWLGYLALAISFAVISSVFGMWQWDRRDQAVAEIDLVQANYDQSPVPVLELLPPDATWDENMRWRQVVLRGEYRPEEQILARTRPRGGQVGFNVLVPLVREDGSVFMVDRGWVPTGEDRDEPDSIPTPPAGQVEVVVRLFPSEPEIPGRSAPEGQVASVALPLIDAAVSGSVDLRAYGQLVEESPPVTPRPLPAFAPVPDEGPHLSYSIQWFVFGLMGFVAWVYLFVQELRFGRQPAIVRRAAPANSDEDFEDSVLDRDVSSGRGR